MNALPFECGAMKQYRVLLLIVCAWLPAACSSGMPKMFYPIEDKHQSEDVASSARHAPLEVPPELRGEATVPIPDNIAREAEAEKSRTQAVAGKAVSLDARLYGQSPGRVFSAVVDAMTALNMPLDSVDSPSGTITTEWMRRDAGASTAYINSVFNMFGASKASHVRHRFIVRILRMKDGGRTRLEIRSLGQAFINQHWVNKKIKRKVANELFSAVEEQLGLAASSPVESKPVKVQPAEPQLEESQPEEW